MNETQATLTSWLSDLRGSGRVRDAARPLVAQLESMHGFALPAPLKQVLEVVGRVQLRDGYGGPIPSEGSSDESWGVFEIDAFVASDGERPFADVLLREHEDFGNGFGLLQAVVPMVPLFKIERRDNVLMVLDPSASEGRGHPLVMLPEESLFDMADPSLWHVADSVEEALGHLMDGGSERLLEAVDYEWYEHAWARHRSVLPFVYLWTRLAPDEPEADSLFEYVWNEIRGVVNHEGYRTPTDVFVDPGSAFYALSRAFFFDADDHCMRVAALCEPSGSPLIRDMGRTFGELVGGRRQVGRLDVQAVRERVRSSGLTL